MLELLVSEGGLFRLVMMMMMMMMMCERNDYDDGDDDSDDDDRCKCRSTCIETYTSSTVLPKKGGDPENDNYDGDIGAVE
jgi:hypothetical protein